MTFQNRQNYWERKQISYQSLAGGRVLQKEVWEIFESNGTVLYLECNGGGHTIHNCIYLPKLAELYSKKGEFYFI